MELIAARFTSSMLPNQLSPVQSGRHYFFQALMQEELQLEAFARFSAFNSLLPLTDISLNFRVNLLVVDAESRGGQVSARRLLCHLRVQGWRGSHIGAALLCTRALIATKFTFSSPATLTSSNYHLCRCGR